MLWKVLTNIFKSASLGMVIAMISLGISFYVANRTDAVIREQQAQITAIMGGKIDTNTTNVEGNHQLILSFIDKVEGQITELQAEISALQQRQKAPASVSGLPGSTKPSNGPGGGSSRGTPTPGTAATQPPTQTLKPAPTQQPSILPTLPPLPGI